MSTPIVATVEERRFARDPRGPLAAAADHLASLQDPDGAWEGEMVWNTMILAQHVIVRRIIVGERAFDERTRDGIVRHFEVSRLPDGSWGMHPASEGFVFFTALGYVALRLLGLAPEHPLCADALRWLRARPDGIVAIPTWGKFWLAFLDLWPYEGLNPCPPELLLLPTALPFHPSHYYCHTRNIYTALAYLYGRRFRASLGAVGEALRRELFDGRYAEIDFAAHRHRVAESDVFVETHPLMRLALDGLHLAERAQVPWLRRRALARCLAHVVAEQRATRYQALSPVNGLLDCLVLYDADRDHPDLAPSLAGVEAWRWEDAREGIRYAGARSHTWDTAFALQALATAPGPLVAAQRETARRAYRYLVGAQIVEELPDRAAQHRDPMRGGWCFSDGAHRWPVSDCTAEAVSALLAAERVPELAPPIAERIDDGRLGQARDFLLSRQNDDGGFGTYERRRGGRLACALVEGMNTTEMYGSCMTERSYLECTASSVAALVHLRAARPHLAGAAVDRAIARGVALIRETQRADGSFPGFWGVNFTYGAFHAVRALVAVGTPKSDPALSRAAAWLVAHQKADGGWGEHHESCLRGAYVEHPETQPVMTAWAVLALLEVLGPDAEPVRRGLDWLARAQRADGSWPEGAPNGVFFGSAMLDYRLYRSYFPTWALGRHAALRALTE